MAWDNEAETILASLEAKAARQQLIGNSAAFKGVLGSLGRMARSGVPVLIEGETGTGKEMLGRAIHYQSKYAAGPFIAVNCATLQDSLIENELFGHEAGAYTDAHRRDAGLLGLAEGGTLFLDEVDALSPRGQRVLLRTLQERAYRPVGGGREKHFDARILSASNTSLRRLASENHFRWDLLFRLNVLFLWLPPLRERREDLPELAGHFLRKHAREGFPEPRLSEAAWEWLRGQPWPGNIRELENAVIRAVHMAEADTIEPRHLAASDLSRRPSPDPGSGGTGAAPPPSQVADTLPLESYNARKKQVLEGFEKEYLVSLMRAVHGNVTQASILAQKERRDLGRLLKKHGLYAKAFLP